MAAERGGSMNGDADGPDEPGTTPAAEAGRAGGRFEAMRQRSAAVQDQVSRRREELERSRHLGLLLVAQRRFKQIEGGDLSVLIALSLFVAMVPVVLLCFSWLTGFSSSANLASLIIRHYDLHEPVAGIVRDTFASASADRSSSSVLGVASWAVAGFPLAVSVQKTFARAWRVPMLPWIASYLRGGLWFLLYVATQLGVETAKWTLGRNLGFGVLAGLAGVALTFVLWGATPHLLLGKDLGGWRGLVPTAIAGTGGDGGAAAAVAAAAAQVACLVGDPVRGHRHQHGTAVGGAVAGDRLGGGGGVWRRLLGAHRRPGHRHPGRTRPLSHHSGERRCA
jgi:hypothetical protein